MNTPARIATMTRRHFLTSLSVGLLAAAAAPGGGCGTSGKPPRPLHVYFGIDASRGTRAHLGAYAAAAAAVSETLHPGAKDMLTLYRLDRETTEFSEGPNGGDAANTLATILREMQAAPRRNGTFPATFWRRVADDVAAADAGEEVVVVLASDGDSDDQSAAARRSLKEAAHRLARCPRLRAVVLCGVEASNRAAVRDAFPTLGARRLRILGPSEMPPDRVAQLVDRARRP